MKNFIALFSLVLLIFSCCPTKKISQNKQISPVYAKEVHFGSLVTNRPHTLVNASGGDILNNSCIKGSYYHQYNAEGRHKGEVWLCCVPVEELLDESFVCGNQLAALPELHVGAIYTFEEPEYIKITTCFLIHPTEVIPTYIPVCIPAPYTAPEMEKPK